MDKENSNNTCHVCDKRFSRKQCVVEHLRNVHKLEVAGRSSIKCTFDNCEQTFPCLRRFRSHLQRNHDFHTEEEKLTFPNYEEFLAWKTKEEERSFSHFVCNTGWKKLSNAIKKRYFICNRSGQYKFEGTGLRKTKSQGTCKIGSFCPAAIEVEEKFNMIYVIYYKTHHGHDIDLRHIPVTLEKCPFVAEISISNNENTFSEDSLKSLRNPEKPVPQGISKYHCDRDNEAGRINCENKAACGFSFKALTDGKKNINGDAVKIITGTTTTTTQIISVPFQNKDREYRGFVQLPEVENSFTENDIASATKTTAHCFVKSCRKFVTQQYKQQQEIFSNPRSNPCHHMKAAVQCSTRARPLTLKTSILNALQISNEVKQSIWFLATATAGPLVQRVSKNTMVVKCKTNAKHPLGYLHCTFFEFSKNKDSVEHKFHCSCTEFNYYKLDSAKGENMKRCVHFYACICGFASNEQLSEEFAFYLHLDLDNTLLICEPEAETISEELPTVLEPVQSKKRKRDEELDVGNNINFLVQENNNSLIHEDNKKIFIWQIPSKISCSVGNVKQGSILLSEAEVSISFQKWLASVTERINQTMHYQFDGNPAPLVFHVPQAFFQRLKERIVLGSKKNEFPSSVVGFERKDALPLGTFSKYTYHITSILHCRQIFDTEEVPLEITKRFSRNPDGTYDVYKPPPYCTENASNSIQIPQLSIKPLEFKTFLKVGSTNPAQNEPTPFVIEWIPDILPKMRIGELRLKFEYGHMCNGLIEHRFKPATSVIQIITSPIILIQPMKN